MTKAFIETINLYFSEITGKSSEGINPENLEEIIKIAKSQGIYCYVLLALKRLYDENRLALSEQDIKNIKMILFNASTVNTNKLIMFSDVLKQFEEAGIECCVLKGESLARFYYEPAFRISGDIDVLVSPENEEKAIAILRKNKFKVVPRSDGSPHDLCYHESMGRIELHVMLYSDFMEDIWFDKCRDLICEQQVEVISSNGYSYRTLGITDGFINVFLHGVEHFLTDCMGLRHISDILLYLVNNINDIDFKRVFDVLDRLKYKKFLDNILGIGIMYGGLEKEQIYSACYDEELCDKMLQEIYDFGIFGANTVNVSFFPRYTKLRYNTFEQRGDPEKFLKQKYIRYVKNFLSLSRKNMENLYDGEYIWKARIKHINVIKNKLLNKIKKKLRQKNSTACEQGIFKNREKLVKDLDMI